VGWQRVRGHEALIDGFRRVLARGRLAHAYLFVGPAGVGKRLFATELARALLCERPPGPLTACDQCPACVQIDAGTHPDFFAAARPAEAAGFPIDLMRDVCTNFALKSARGKGKVVVVDDADELDDPITQNAAANAFLKTLEEPPPRSVLILIGSSAERQLPTIVSRCQVVRFAGLPADLVRQVLTANGVSEPQLRERLVRLSGGSPGVALTLAEPALWQFRERLLAGLTARPIDAVELGKAWSEFVEEAGKESAVQRRQAQLVLRLVIDVLADCVSVSQGGEPRRTTGEDEPLVRRLASQVDAEVLLAVLERCLEADEQIDRRVQLVLVLEALLDALAQRLVS
jgi:DNA polymerase-3 subunit delta'